MPPLFERLPLCDRVRQSCRWVTERATLVSIDDDALDELAGRIDIEPATAPSPAAATPHSPLTTEEVDEATLVLALDAINFGSGYHDVIRKRPGLSGSSTMAASLTDYVGFTGPLDPDRLQRITTVDCSQIFGQELDDGAQEELMSLFATALCDLGAWLEARGGTGEAILAADRSAESFATSLTEMVFYRDVENYVGVDVSFYKRAQITVADLARRVRPFDDLERLTAFADNLVPHVLRMSGALQYDDTLAAAIERRTLLVPGGTADVEIRAAGVECVERLVQRTGSRAMDIDATLWAMGGTTAMKSTPRHRARSVFY